MSDNIARVVECYGRRVVLALSGGELSGGERQQAEVFGKRLRVVCGDHVRYDTAANAGTLQVREILPRTTEFTRTDSRGQAEVLAANITQLVVLMCGQPASDPFIVDRYLAGAELGGLKSLVVFTKRDLGHEAALLQHQAVYQAAGYPVFSVAVGEVDSLTGLRAALQGECSMLVGESGVGKSTLTNALLGNDAQLIREISDATGEGRHTTVSSALFNLPGGGELMDSPGVRDYAPAPVNDLQVAFGWREFQSYTGHCRFNNCLHLREPGCAVIAAVASGGIDPRRHDSYKRLLNLMRQLLPSYERR